MTYKPKTEIRGPWPTSDMFVPSESCAHTPYPKKQYGYIQDRVFEYLNAHPLRTTKQISDALLVNKNSVKSAISALVQTKTIEWLVTTSNEFRRARHYRVTS